MEMNKLRMVAESSTPSHSLSLHRSLFAHLQNIDFHRFSIIVLFGAGKKNLEN